MLKIRKSIFAIVVILALFMGAGAVFFIMDFTGVGLAPAESGN